MSKTTRSKGAVDLLHGPIFKNILIFAIPICISLLFQHLYNVVDTAIVGNVLGEHALASIGASTAVFDMIIGFALNLGAGLAIVISRAFGSGEEEKMKRAVAGSMVIGGITVVLISLLCVFGLRPLLILLKTPEAILDEALSYILIIGVCSISFFAYNLCSGILRAIGNSLVPLLFLVFSSLCNIFLDYAFLAWLHMGVEGAAIATVLSQTISAVLCAGYMIVFVKEVVPKREHFAHVGKELYIDLAGQGYAMAMMGSVVSIGSVTLQSAINGLGTDIIAGHVAARKAYLIFMMPVTSVAMSIATFVGQNYGAGNRERILKAMRSGYIWSFCTTAGIVICVWKTAPTIIRLVSGSANPVIVQNGARYMMVAAPFYCVLGVLLQTRSSLQSLGSKIIPTLSSMIECVGKIVFTMVFVPMFAYEAVIWSEPVVWSLMAIYLYISYRRNPYIRG